MNKLIDNQEALYLVVDTTSPKLSLTLFLGQQVLANLEIKSSGQAGSNLLKDIDYFLSRLNIKITNLNFLGILIGPGSFTGIRIGLATIKGLGQCLGLHIVMATTLEIIAYAGFKSKATDYVCVIQKAHRSEIYSQIFNYSNNGELVYTYSPMFGTEENLTQEILIRLKKLNQKRILFTGDAKNCIEQILKTTNYKTTFEFKNSNDTRQVEQYWSFLPSPDFLAQTASGLINIRWANKLYFKAPFIFPYYIRPSEAEIKIK